LGATWAITCSSFSLRATKSQSSPTSRHFMIFDIVVTYRANSIAAKFGKNGHRPGGDARSKII
jgi:hypothetical protein